MLYQITLSKNTFLDQFIKFLEPKLHSIPVTIKINLADLKYNMQKKKMRHSRNMKSTQTIFFVQQLIYFNKNELKKVIFESFIPDKYYIWRCVSCNAKLLIHFH